MISIEFLFLARILLKDRKIFFKKKGEKKLELFYFKILILQN